MAMRKVEYVTPKSYIQPDPIVFEYVFQVLHTSLSLLFDDVCNKDFPDFLSSFLMTAGLWLLAAKWVKHVEHHLIRHNYTYPCNKLWMQPLPISFCIKSHVKSTVYSCFKLRFY